MAFSVDKPILVRNLSCLCLIGQILISVV